MSNNKQYSKQYKQQEPGRYYDQRQNNNISCREKNSNSGRFNNHNNYSRTEDRDYNDTEQIMQSDKFGDMTIYELSNNNTFMIVGYLLCWPFCLYLMWKYNNWNKTVKIVVSIVCGLFGLGILIKFVGAIGIFSLFL